MLFCIICNREGAKVCQGCHSASYCLKQCQTKDYRIHKLLCSRFKEYQDRPEEHERRGIIFPECEKSPLWVWIKTESKDGYQSLVLDDHLTTSSQAAKKVLFLDIQHNESRWRALDDTLVIGYCDKKVRGDSSPNRSIQVVAKGATTSPWYGPVLVMKKMGLETNVGAYGDMYLTDYSDAIDSLRYDYLPGKGTVSQGGSNIRSLYSARTVQVVIISCSGDIKALGADKFIPVAVSIFDPVIVADKLTSSEMLGVPVRVRKLPPHPAWKDSGVMDIYKNQEATRLFRDMDPEHKDFGLISRYWDLGVGSVLVVRDDGKDITPQQVEALCYYGYEHTMDMFQDAFEYYDFTRSKKEMVELAALFNPKAFREFFADFKAKKMGNDASWVTAESPV